MRRFGAAALDLAWVAAGILMVREAGGYATDIDGDDAIFAKKQVIAGNEFIHKQLLEALKAANT